MDEEKKIVTIKEVQEYFDIPDFRPNQKEIMEAIINKKDVMAVLPTSGGKSICYQYPATQLEGITIVVSPLIALMKDQVENLYKNKNKDGIPTKIPAESLNSQSGKLNPDEIMRKAVNGDFKLLYVSPERLSSPKFIRFAKHLNISLIAVDESHCISLWGYDFRPNYLEIRRFIDNLEQERPVIAAFTATASKHITESIIELLGMQVAEEEIFIGDYERKNLNLTVESRINSSGKYNTLYPYLKKHNDVKGIIYCSTVKQVKSMYEKLSEHKNNYAVAHYYGGLDKAQKEESYNKFKSGECKIMVATNAFGMGVDIEDIRYVIHFDMPRDLESYYQEIGRAGRDRKNAECILLCSQKEIDNRYAMLDSIKRNRYIESDGKMIEMFNDVNKYRLDKMVAYGKWGKRIGRKNIPSEKLSSNELQEMIVDYFNSTELETKLEKISPIMTEHILRELKKIKVLYTNETKIAHIMQRGQYKVGQRKTIKIDRASKGALEVTFEIDKKLSYFDLMVADAVYTLHVWKKEKIYPQNILGLLSGDEVATMKPQGKSAKDQNLRSCIIESLERMRTTEITIERSNGMMGFMIGEEKKRKTIEGAFLPIEKVGENSYKITKTPPLYEYAELTNGQIYAIPSTMLLIKQKKEKDKTGEETEWKSKMPHSVENLKLRHFLARRNIMARTIRTDNVPSIKPKIKDYRTIRFEKTEGYRKGMFEMLDVEIPKDSYDGKRKRDVLYQKIFVILDYYKKQKLLTSYELQENSNNEKNDKYKVYDSVLLKYPPIWRA